MQGKRMAASYTVVIFHKRPRNCGGRAHLLQAKIKATGPCEQADHPHRSRYGSRRPCDPDGLIQPPYSWEKICCRLTSGVLTIGSHMIATVALTWEARSFLY